MTIIQPHQASHKTNFFIFSLVFILIIGAVWGVFLYNQLVSFRHETKKQEANIGQAEAINAELKSELYSILDTKNLASSTNEQSLILDKNPEYIKTAKLTLN